MAEGLEGVEIKKFYPFEGVVCYPQSFLKSPSWAAFPEQKVNRSDSSGQASRLSDAHKRSAWCRLDWTVPEKAPSALPLRDKRRIFTPPRQFSFAGLPP